MLILKQYNIKLYLLIFMDNQLIFHALEQFSHNSKNMTQKMNLLSLYNYMLGITFKNFNTFLLIMSNIKKDI